MSNNRIACIIQYDKNLIEEKRIGLEAEVLLDAYSSIVCIAKSNFAFL